jgi:hypothetical protein
MPSRYASLTATPIRSSGEPKGQPMIIVDHLTKRYGTVATVDGLSFEVRQPNTGQAIPGKSGGVTRQVWYR